LMPTGLSTLTARQVSCHNFTADPVSVSEIGYSPGTNLDDSLASRRTAATSSAKASSRQDRPGVFDTMAGTNYAKA
jgi:hypothetical protein